MRWFGPNRDVLWRQLAQELRAEFIEARFWKGRECKVRAHLGPWTATLETGFSTEEDGGVTRLCAPFLNPEGFRFTVHRRVFLNDVGKLLGTLQNIDVGHPEFDDAFVVQSNDASKVRAVLADAEIRKMALAHPKSRLVVLPIGGWFKPKFPPGVDELQLQVAGKLKDLNRLRAMFKLFAAVLDRLCETGVTPKITPAEVA